MLKKVEAIKDAKKDTPATIAGYSKYKGQPMVTLSGNFFGGGFNISKNKVKAILDNSKELKRFVSGEFDKDIAELADNEKLVFSED